MQKIEIYDTTLRDGSQGAGISFSLEEKLIITKILDDLGVDFIEGGWPGSNPKDELYFKKVKEVPLKNAKIAAFSSTRRKGTLPHEDFFLQQMVDSNADCYCIFGKSWDRQVLEALNVSLDENLLMIKDSIEYLKKETGRPIFFDCEHFFDGYKSNSIYAEKVIKAAHEAGAERVILCDTNGGSFPEEIRAIVGNLKILKKVKWGIHAHNDGSLAVANTLDAVFSGCKQVQGTFNGIGERCGNTDLTSVIPNLQLKKGYNCLPSDGLKNLFKISQKIWELTHSKDRENQPFVGRHAFSHKGGIHVSAIDKAPEFYEHIKPELIGNKRNILISELSGRSNILSKFKTQYPQLDDKKVIKKILNLIQEKEKEGLSFEGADAGLELLLRETLGFKDSFLQKDYLKISDINFGKKKFSEASLSFFFKGRKKMAVSEGVGPIDALSKALRKSLIPFYPKITQLKLTDYQVRIIDGHDGTKAKVRVIIEHQFEGTKPFSTVGMNENIIEASWDALVDALKYFILKEKQTCLEMELLV